jgi:hydrogenase expression/formation protein HypE
MKVMAEHEHGRAAAIIGEVGKKGRGRLLLNTVIGGIREIDLPTGELVPRIC